MTIFHPKIAMTVSPQSFREGLLTDHGRPWLLALGALVLGAMAMGASPVCVRLAKEAGVGPFASAFWRMLLALPALWLWARWEDRRRGFAPSRRDWRGPAMLAGIAFAGDMIFWHLSILNTTVANATFFATLAPLFVILCLWAVFREAIPRAVLAGLVICILGGLALVGESMQVDPRRLTGDVYGIITAVFFGLSIIAVDRARRELGAARTTFIMSCIAALLLFTAALLSGEIVFTHTPKAWVILVALALISQVLGIGLMALALGQLPATFSSLVIFMEAVFAAAFGWVILGEAISPIQALGGVLILLGIWTARPRQVKPALNPVGQTPQPTRRA